MIWHRVWLTSSLGVLLLFAAQPHMEAARKYYPPGFVPPANETLLPEAEREKPATAPETQASPTPSPSSERHHVPSARPRPEKPKDPLQTHIEARRYYDALRIVDDRLKKSPRNVGLQLLKAQLLRESGDYAPATELYEKILKTRYSAKTASWYQAKALNGLGWTHYAQAIDAGQSGNRTAESAYMQATEASFRHAIRLEPGTYEPWAGLAYWAIRQSDAQQAESLIRQASRLSPNAPLVQLGKTRLMLNQGKAAEAMPLLFAVRQKAEREPDVYVQLAEASLQLNKADDAIIHLKRLLDFAPDHTEALKWLSIAYERKMRPKNAQEALEKAIALNPGDEGSVAALLKLYDHAHETDHAILTLRTVLKDHPGNRSYQLALLSRLNGVGRWEDSYAAGLEFLNRMPETPITSSPELDALLHRFSEATYQHHRGLINREPVLENAVVRSLDAYIRKRLDGLYETSGDMDQIAAYRLDLLYIDLLSSLPAMPPGFENRPITPNAMLDSAMAAFLQGDRVSYNTTISQLMSHPALPPGQLLGFGQALLSLGDYTGAIRLAEQAQKDAPIRQTDVLQADTAKTAENQRAEAEALVTRSRQAREKAKSALSALDMMPRRMPITYWEKTASEALRLNVTSENVHDMLADELEDQDEWLAVWRHQMLAARYADSARHRRKWEKRADKTREKHMD